MNSIRRTAVIAGVLFLLTHVTSIPALILRGPVLARADYIVGLGPDTQVLLSAFLDVVLALAVVGTAVALYPVVRQQNEGVALGYVGLRTLEAAVIAVGVVPLLAIVTLRQDLTGAAGPDVINLGSALVALHNWTFLVGPSLVLGTNTVLLAYLLYRSGLVPRFTAVLGLVGGPLVFVSGAAQLFGLYEQYSTLATIPAAPVFAWELTSPSTSSSKGSSRLPSPLATFPRVSRTKARPEGEKQNVALRFIRHCRPTVTAPRGPL